MYLFTRTDSSQPRAERLLGSLQPPLPRHWSYFCGSVADESWIAHSSPSRVHVKTRGTSLPHPEWPYALRYLYRRRCTYPEAWWPERLNCVWWCLFSAQLLKFLVPHEYVYLLIYTEQKAPDDSAVHRSIQCCVSSAESLLLVNLVAPGVMKWCLVFRKICALLITWP
jgi:hypothetical protein